MVHPLDCNWQDKILNAWAKTHTAQMERLESATEYQHQIKVRERELREEAKQQEKNRKATYDYVVEYYEMLFPSSDKVKK